MSSDTKSKKPPPKNKLKITYFKLKALALKNKTEINNFIKNSLKFYNTCTNKTGLFIKNIIQSMRNKRVFPLTDGKFYNRWIILIDLWKS